MNYETVCKKMEYLNFQYVPTILQELTDAAIKEDQNPLQSFDGLLSKEIDFREERRIATSMKISGLPKGMFLDTFDCGHSGESCHPFRFESATC